MNALVSGNTPTEVFYVGVDSRTANAGTESNPDATAITTEPYYILGKSGFSSSIIPGPYSLTVGNGAYASGANAIAIGKNAKAFEVDGFAVGENAEAYGYAIALGKSSQAFTGGISIGKSATSNSGVAIGTNSISNGQ